MGYFYSLLLYLLYTLLLVYVSEIFLKIFLLKLFMTVILGEVGRGGGGLVSSSSGRFCITLPFFISIKLISIGL